MTLENISNQVIDESLTQEEHEELKALCNKWIDEGLSKAEQDRMQELEEKEWL